MSVFRIFALFLLSLVLCPAFAATNFTPAFKTEYSKSGCPIKALIYAQQKDKECSCKSCNNAECCGPGPVPITCKDDCSTLEWTVPAGSMCGDDANADLCCVKPKN
jgi:hypothetical protein